MPKSGIPVTIGSLDVTKFAGILFVNIGAILGLKNCVENRKGLLGGVGCNFPRVSVVRDGSTVACQTCVCSD